MEIILKTIESTDAEKLFEFELENRSFFEQMIPSRGDDYYNFEYFKKRHEALLDEQALGVSYYYLIQDKNDSILGRINLVDIEESQILGHLGYRIGQIYTGKGIATKALKMLLETITEKGIRQIKAKTTTNNTASQKILEKNGFKYIATGDEECEMTGEELKFIYYIWNSEN